MFYNGPSFNKRVVVSTAQATDGVRVTCGFEPGVVSVVNRTNGATLQWDSSMRDVRIGALASVSGDPTDDTFSVTIGDKVITQAGDTNVATTAAALVVLLNASTDAEFANITWSVPSAAYVKGVADNDLGMEYLAQVVLKVYATGADASTGTVTAFGGYSALKSTHFSTTFSTGAGSVITMTGETVAEVTGAISLDGGSSLNGRGFILTGALADIADTATEVLAVSVLPNSKTV